MPLQRKLSIGQSERVLEIGPGSFPHTRADVLVERYIGAEGKAQRGGVELVNGGKPLVVADGTALPFGDKSFDLIICSHVLEHVEQVDLFLRELGRVAKRRYIECPSEVYELLWGCDEHVWFLYSMARILVLRRKTPGSYRGRYFGYLFPSMLDSMPEWSKFMETYPELWFVSYDWTGSPVCTILSEECRVVDYTDGAWLKGMLEHAKRNQRRRARYVWMSAVRLPKSCLGSVLQGF